MRKVLFGTPCYDGKVAVEFLQSLLHTIPLCAANGITLHPVQISHDATIHRARNDLVKLALDTECDDLFFMDSDQEWEPQTVLDLLTHPVDVVGAPVVKKSDTLIDFNIKVLPGGLQEPVDGLLEVASIGTGCLRLSRHAFHHIWIISEEYRGGRMVFDPRVHEGELVSEDTSFCIKWRGIGGKVWVDPKRSCAHFGQKKYYVDFASCEFAK
jgi:hypothetical protein